MRWNIRCCHFALLLLALIALLPPRAVVRAADDPTRPDQAVLLPPQVARTRISGADLGYLSPPTEARHPFTHLLARREASVPAGATLTLSVRASTDGVSWSAWQQLEDDADLLMPDDGPNVVWSNVVDVGATARVWQVHATFTPTPGGALPDLRRIEVNTVNALNFGPAQATAAQTRNAATTKPAVVSRVAWGSPDGEGSRARPDYYPVNHLIIHHTADSDTLYDSEPNWAARVRAIWAFHTITRGWGDIGYNYVIDPNGVIYEGRAGGDDAVGFHDAANYGSMGVSVIGTWTKQPMPDAARYALVGLLAWKADQQKIDPLGQSYYYGCDISPRCRPSHPGAVVQNIAGHKQVTPGYTADPSDLTIAMLPDIRNQIKALIGGQPPSRGRVNAELTGIRFDRTTVASGALLKVTFGIKNTGDVTLQTQAPQASTEPNGTWNDGSEGRSDDGYVYDEGECFAGNATGSYPIYAKESDRFRLVLGLVDAAGSECVSDTGGYPWRWGLNGELAPGATRDIIGYVRFRNYGLSNRVITLGAGLIQENMRYFAQNIGVTTITVTPERALPVAVSYDSLLHPLAQVYRLGDIPDNFLARTRNPLSIPRGAYVGSIVWNGGLLDWGASGPLGLSDQFLVEQTRAFTAPVAGTYTFRTTSDDGSWLWIDGQPVVTNNGLHSASGITGTIMLDQGPHILSFKYFERSGNATMGYSMQLPGADSYVTPSDALGDGALALGSTFVQTPNLSLAADDQGGVGVDRMRWSWDGAVWQESPGALLQLGKLQNGSYRLRYQPLDRLGNVGETRELAFNVDTTVKVHQVFLPLADANGIELHGGVGDGENGMQLRFVHSTFLHK